MFLRDLLIPSHLFLVARIVHAVFRRQEIAGNREGARRRNTVIQIFGQRDQQSGVASPIIAISQQAEMDWKLQPASIVRVNRTSRLSFVSCAY